MTALYLGLMFIGIVLTMTGWFMMRDARRHEADD